MSIGDIINALEQDGYDITTIKYSKEEYCSPVAVIHFLSGSRPLYLSFLGGVIYCSERELNEKFVELGAKIA